MAFWDLLGLSECESVFAVLCSCKFGYCFHTDSRTSYIVLKSVIISDNKHATAEVGLNIEGT